MPLTPDDIHCHFRSFRRAARAVAIALLAIAPSPAWPSPELFFYPPPVRLGDGSVIASPVMLTPAQITTDFPVVREMSGIVMIVYWSQLCPTVDECNLDIIKDALAYWGSRGKKVVLSVATVGFPIKTATADGFRFIAATPDWLLPKIRTFTELSRTIDTGGQQGQAPTTFPSYADPKFNTAVRNLVNMIGRFDGNSALARVRISTGLLGEDNPSVDGYRSKMPDFTPQFWIDYSHALVAMYGRACVRTPLEFDIGYLSWAWVLGDARVKTAVDRFVADLIAKRVMIAFNGLQSNTQSLIGSPGTRTTAGPARSIAYLQQAKEEGCPIGLEAAGPLTAKRMEDIASIAGAVERLRPDRLVLFGTDAGLLNFARNGSNETNRSTREFLKGVVPNQATDRVGKLLQRIQ
jgi:hypothetical protein